MLSSPLVLACLGLLGGISLQTVARDATSEERELSVRAPLASRSLLLDGVSVDGRVVVVGERGHILVSDNQGHSWRQAIVPTQATLTGVFFYDKSLGWAVGHDAIILRTRDGGDSWERVYYAPEQERPFLDVWFSDAEQGFAIGAYGLFLETTDGGDTWTPRHIRGRDDDLAEASDLHLNQISGSDTGRLYIAAEAGTIYRSDDEGQTWTTLPSPYRGSFFGTLPLKADRLLLFGLRGHLFRSGDGGESWEAKETGTEAMLTNGLRLADGTIVITGLGGTLLVSHDDGQSFTLHQEPDPEGISGVAQTERGELILLGEFGVRALTPRESTWIERP